MNILIITAHPSKNGFTHKLAATYKNEAEKRQNNVKTLNLYKEKQEFLSFQKNTEVKEKTKDRKFHQKLIKETDELVFIFPVWWGDCPAIMKNWWDQNMTTGFAYEFKGRPIALLKGKTARVITTSGASKLIYIISGLHSSIKSIWKHARLGFCGIKLKSFTLIGNFGSYQNRDETKAIKTVKNLFS